MYNIYRSLSVVPLFFSPSSPFDLYNIFSLLFTYGNLDQGGAGREIVFFDGDDEIFTHIIEGCEMNCKPRLSVAALASLSVATYYQERILFFFPVCGKR